MDLGRRGKVMLNDLDNGSVLSLGLDSTGVGLFDALFASLSMILVSEVQNQIRAKETDKKRAFLTMVELKHVPDDTSVYKSID